MAWSQYSRLLHAHPLKTKALTSSFITGLSDVCLQLYENNSNERPSSKRQFSMAPDTATTSSSSRVCLRHGTYLQAPDLKWSRTLTLAAVGLIYSGPVNHLWFASLEKFVRIRHSGGAVATKLMLDQALFVPAVIAGYMSVRGLFERKSQLEIRTQLQEKVPVAAAAAWQFWPVANFISFSMVPVVYRVLFANACGVFWNARLSLISSRSSAEDTPGFAELALRNVLEGASAFANDFRMLHSGSLESSAHNAPADIFCVCRSNLQYTMRLPTCTATLSARWWSTTCQSAMAPNVDIAGWP